MDIQSMHNILDMIQDVKDVKEINSDLQKIEKAFYIPNYGEKKLTVEEIYKSYPWIGMVISLLPNTSPKRQEQMTEVDYQYVLDMQHKLLDLHGAGKLKEFLDKEYNIK